MTAVEVDVPDTWPDALRTLHERASRDLHAWHDRQQEIDDLCERDVMARLSPPANEYRRQADAFAEAVDDVLSAHSLVCRHCTRLHSTDIERIRSIGVLPLSVDLTQKRLAELRAAGEIDDDELQLLAAESLADASNRRDRTFWILGRGPLRSFSGVHRLFASWGGEATYWAHERKALGRRLSELGTATIIEAAIPYPMLHTTWSVGERFRDALAEDTMPEFVATTRETVHPDNVTRLLFHGSEAFEAMTRASTWPLTL